MLVYLGISILIAGLSVCLFKWFGTGGRLFNYTNPLVIVSSVFFFLSFSIIKMKNNAVVNWIAASSLGAYLLHINPLVLRPYFTSTLASFSNFSSGLLLCHVIFVFLLAVFLAGVLIDKIRLFVWNLLLKAFHAE